MNYPVRGELQYGAPVLPDGVIHTDLGVEDKQLLHMALDEWLSEAKGTGFFFVGNVEDLRNEMRY